MKLLRIYNLILIEKAEIPFGPELNILTGETGSGKSAILTAIRLIAGERAEASWIRKGADAAIVEALFEGSVWIRREIYRSGKNRCFIDEAQVPLSDLKEMGRIELVNQGSSYTLLSQQTSMLDAFAGISPQIALYERSREEEKKIEKELEACLQTPKEHLIDSARKDLAWIEETGWEKGEEEKLAQEHHRLTSSQELAEKISGAALSFSEGDPIRELKKIEGAVDSSARLDRSLLPIAESIKSSLIELEEAARLIQRYADSLEIDPIRLAWVERRIGEIESVKRRFKGDIEQQKKELMRTIDELSGIETKIDELRSALAAIRDRNRETARLLLEQRKKEAPRFALQVLKELKSLNIPHAQFQIEVGEELDPVCFLFSANAGQSPSPLKQCASGGELSRLLLAIKTILSEGNGTLVFDEIDSNVGGNTAAILGEKLKQLGEKRQIICVTHFVQVAKWALDHFLVSKTILGDRSVTKVEKLSEKQREIEYSRMLGGGSTSLATLSQTI